MVKTLISQLEQVRLGPGVVPAGSLAVVIAAGCLHLHDSRAARPNQAISDEGLSGSTIRMCKELAFVTTDLMDSTKMAAASVSGFQQVQDIHDTVR